MPIYPPDLSGLRYFRFIHALGGHARDRLCVAWPADLPPVRLPPAIHALPEGHGQIAGVAVFRSRSAGRVYLDVLDPDHLYDVTDRSVEGAARVERILEAGAGEGGGLPLAGALIDPPEDTERCVWPGGQPPAATPRRSVASPRRAL